MKKVETGYAGPDRDGLRLLMRQARKEYYMMEGRISVFEDHVGRVRAYVRETGVNGVRVYDCWERFDFGCLRKCVYEWLFTGVLDGVERTYSEVEERNDNFNSTLIVKARRDRYGAVHVRVGSAVMGPAGKHAWGIKEED